MSTKQFPDAPYIRVRHLGVSKGSLYLADLDDEENKKQGKGVPVYIPENGTVDIPLDADVLHSYQQGSIRGFIEDGKADANFIEDDGEAEVWVAPTGDDSNPGTKTAPFASIQTAIDHLVTVHGHDAYKTVRLEAGEYVENLVIATRHLSLIGRGSYRLDSSSAIRPATGDRPVVSIVNASKAGFESYVSDGGLDYTWDGSTFSYTGAALAGRDIEVSSYTEAKDVYPGSEGVWFDINIENIKIIWADTDPAPTTRPVGLAVLGFPGNASDGHVTVDVVRLNSMFFALSGYSDQTSLYTKNARQVYFGAFSADHNSDVVLDRSGEFYINGSELTDISNDWSSLIIRATGLGGSDTTEGTQPWPDTWLLAGGYIGGNINSLDALGPVSLTHLFRNHPILPLSLPNTDISLNTSVAVSEGSKSPFPFFAAKTLTMEGSGEYTGHTLQVSTLIKNSSGSLTVESLSASGNVTISGGTINEIKGGTIEGNLTVNAPAVVDLTNVTVKGDLNGDGTLTMNGGGYLGTNNTTGTFTYTALKTT